jgi:ribosome-binding factor A
MLRVAELIRHALAELLSRNMVPDPVLEKQIVTIPRVKMSPDLKLATVYILPLGGADSAPVLEALDRQRKILRSEVARRISLKSAPELRFRADDSFDNTEQINALFRSDKVRQDLQGAIPTPALAHAHAGFADDGDKGTP